MVKRCCPKCAIAQAARAIALLVIVLIPARVALSHAEYVRSLPAADSIVVTAPVSVKVWFSEGLTQNGSSLIVRDANGVRVDNGDTVVSPADAQLLIVTLKPLPDGIYTVFWQSASSDDGHLTKGYFPFTVGAAQAGTSYTALLQEVDHSIRAFQPPDFLDAILGLLVILSFILLTGTLIFQPLILHGHDLKPIVAVIDPSMRRLAGISLALAWSATILSAWHFLARVGWGELTGRYGIVLTVRVVMLLMISASLWKRRERSRWIILPALGLLLTQSLLSHSASEPQWVAPVLADWVHFSFTAVWLGGVAVLALVIAPAALTGLTYLKELGLVITRFSPLALFSVFAIALTGIAQSASFVGSVEALFTTAYGRAILAKIGLLIVLVAFGAFHQQVVSPRLQAWRLRDTQGAMQAARRFRVSILGEALVSLILIATVGVLIALPLARDTATDLNMPAVIQVCSADDLTMTLGIAPAQAGINQFVLDVRDGSGTAVTGNEAVLSFDNPAANTGETVIRLNPHGNGSYVAQTGMLSMTGNWRITATVRRSDLHNVSIAYSLDIP